MNTIKIKATLLASAIVILLLGLIGLAGAIGTQTQCTFDPKNGTEKTIITLDASNSFQSVVPTAPVSPSGKVFLGWASRNAGDKYPTIEFWHDAAGQDTFSFSDGTSRSYFADYATLRTAKTYPYVKYGYLSEHTDGFAQVTAHDPTQDVCAYDYYQTTLTAGTKYYFELSMPGRAPDFFLYDKDFSELASGEISIENADQFAHYGDKIIEYTPTTTDTYYVGVCASQYEDMGLYQMIYSTQKVMFPKFKIEWISAGKVARTSELDPGENIIAPSVARWGYTFAGWYRDISFTKAFKTDEEIMPVGNIAFFAKWTSNESELKGMYKSTGHFTQKWTGINYINRLRIRERTSSVTIRPIPRNSKSTMFMKYKDGTYKIMSTMKISLKKGQTKTVYIKCVSQTGTKYTSVYKLLVTRKK